MAVLQVVQLPKLEKYIYVTYLVLMILYGFYVTVKESFGNKDFKI
jgi:hypothetical protein